ncbi:MAG: DUF6049 family protein [Lacisediminihabitans sp.]
MRLVIILLALAMGLGALGFGDSSAQAKTTHAQTDGVSLVAAPSASGVLRPNADLVISGILSNGTNTPIAAGTVSVYLDRSVVSSRTELNNWLDKSEDGDHARTMTEVLQGTSPAVPAGEVRTVYLTVPAASIGLDPSPSAWGTRALSVRISNGASEVATATSSIVWFPGGTFQPTKLSLVAPIAAPPGTVGLISADDLAALTGPSGVLTRELDQSIDRQVALAIDPMIIASIRILGKTAPTSAQDWLLRLSAASNDSFALSYADADLATMSQLGTGKLLTPTDFPIDPKLFPTPQPTPTPSATPGLTADPTQSPAPVSTEPVLPTSKSILDWNYTIKSLAWPLDGTVIDKDLDTFAANGLTTTLVNSSNASYGNVGYTPGAAVTVGGHPVLVADATVSRLFRSAVTAPTAVAWQQAIAELSASIAIATSERPDDVRNLVGTLGRTYPTSTGWRLSDTLAALSELPWVGGSTLSNAMASKPVGATITAKPVAASRVNQVKTLLNAENSVATFSAVLVDPPLLTGPRRLDLLATISGGWTGDPAGWKSAFAHYIKTSATISQSVTIVESSSIIQPSDKISLPVTVRNDLDFPVAVIVTVRSPSGILHVVENRVPLTVEAHSQAGARVAVQSVANGDVVLKVSLSSVSGVPIAQPSFVDVNVQAQWETAITVSIGILLLAVFGFGIWRNILKRRKARGTRSETDNGSDPGESDPNAAETEATGTMPSSAPPMDTPRD